MAQTLDLTEGWTQRIEYDLLDDEASFDGSLCTPTIVITDRDGTAVTVTGDVEWATATASRVRYTPDAADLTAAGSPYTVHWKVTDGSGRISFYPQGAPILWRVYAQ